MNYSELQQNISAMDVWVCSYGGSGCNLLSNYLENKGFLCRTSLWHSTLCHYYTYIPTDTLSIYIYSNPIDSLKSQKFRQTINSNIGKLSNGIIQKVSDEALMYCMCSQFYNWNFYRYSDYKILFLRYENLNNSLDKLSKFLSISTDDFPLIQERKSSHVNIIHEQILQNKYYQFIKDASSLD